MMTKDSTVPSTRHIWSEHSQPDVSDTDILVRDLVKIYASTGVEVQALQGLSLKVSRGEVVAIIGASGSGKSTLLSILSGHNTPTAGQAWVAGRNLTTLTPRQRIHFARSSVGFVWQNTTKNLISHLSVLDNVMLPLGLGAGEPHRLRTRRAQRRRAHEVLTSLQLDGHAHLFPAALNSAEQQRLAIAVALAGHPRVILADEPTGDLDDHASRDVLAAFTDVSGQFGTTVVVVTHDPTIANHVQRTIAIRDGRTSLEVLRRTTTTPDGQVTEVVEEFAVIDQVGRVQIPAEFTHELGLVDRVRLAMTDGHVEIRPEGHS